MIHTRQLLAAALVAAASVGLAAKDGTITLRKALKTGTESYHMEATGKATITLGGADQELNTTTVTAYSYKIGLVDAAAGKAPVEVTTKVEKFDMDGPMAAFLGDNKDKMLVKTTSSGIVDNRNRFTIDPNKKVDPRSIVTGAAASMVLGPYIEFPEKAVSVGDTWDVIVPKGPTTTKEDQKLTAKLTGEKQVDGKDVYVVSLSGSYKTDVNLGELIKANPTAETDALGALNMLIKATTDVTGEINVDKATGQTISMSLKMTSKQEAQLPDQNLTIPSVSNQTVNIKLDK